MGMRAGLAAGYLALALAIAAPPALAAPAPTPGEQATAYVLGYGDALNVQVQGADDVAVKVQPIRPDGRLSLPLLGEVQAGGLTVAQLTLQLTQAYRKYFTAPRVLVNVASFRPLRISVLGLVNKPGTYDVPRPVRLLDALALAGGLDRERSSLHDVVVIQPHAGKRVVDVAPLLAGQAPDDLVLEDGATVQVAEVAGIDWYRTLPPVASAIGIVGTVVLLYLQRR